MKEHHSNGVGSDLRDIILGGQDGLVNVLGVILAVATATQDAKIVILAGLAATFAESLSMAAVGYTSSKAAKQYYDSELEREKREIKEVPEQEKREIRDIYRAKGFRGKILDSIVKHITSDKKLWLDTMMEEELKLSKEGFENPLRNAWVIGVSAIVGSLVPLTPFLFMQVQPAMIASLVFSTVVLFACGYYKNQLTVGNPLKGGLEMAFIGMITALIGYAIGAVLGIALF